MTASDAFRKALDDHRAGRLDQAAAGYAAIVAADPDHLPAATNLAVLLYDQSRFADAVPLLETALRLDPALTEARYILALCLMRTGRPDAARDAFARAASDAPDDPRPLTGLAALALAAGDFSGALERAEQALVRDAANADALNLKGAALKESGDFAAARDQFERALEVDPDHAEARANRGAIRLLLGEMPAAWTDYAWRWRGTGRRPPGAELNLPLWRGEDLAGGRLLLIGEQGFGDTIQCLRYLTGLTARGLRTSVRCRPELKRLVAGLPDVETVWSADEAAPAGDAYLPMMDLPGLFGTAADEMPGAEGYLTAEPAADVSDGTARTVGLVWAGSPTHENDARRSLPLAALGPLLDVPDVRLFSLQVGPGRDDLAACGFSERITDLAPRIGDFADTAALVQALDLVITADTAVAHLAGALGKPASVMLPFVPDWRWGLEGAETPWYASLRLYRQPAAGDWAAVVRAIVHDLGSAKRMGDRPDANGP